ncbi:hypothetical protein TVAG_276160 [Trichomonas vaginalis G3]|uniref:Alpha/beta hydrolase fold-3 domain-containing protein n=1 Tax=Trichomonas vaginalis (strain ATCC PRA-98 / G3) TaxID=412133 RepID=A2ECP7_TRIV3|nr:carboxylic ester hydrolase protein [Trichomonas vaginalis G3]EAY09543.1 hypothetical protein TVAG_276160 [Trichomonas vaginalis G3]KAI5533170.1 carboxylic ester hydrolase protein [Trichomonas vaginalis G3]|eukprot:XP_001321766.1 hypothetical protein [Trichomonas vaginalis G3]
MTIDNLPQKESILLKYIKLNMVLFNMKKQLENECKTGKFWIKPCPFPFFLRLKYDYSETKFGNRSYWTIKPKHATSDNLLFYFHGGGFIRNIVFWQWMLVADLISRTNATFIIPNYEIAPYWTYKETYEFIKDCYLETLKLYPHMNIHLIGDSAGGGFILSFANSLKELGVKQPKNLLMIAPWLDLSGQNTDYYDIVPYDKLLDYNGGVLAANLFAGKMNKEDPRLSPLFGNLKDLPRMAIFVGTHDSLMADCRLLRKRLINESIPHEYHEFPNMFHVFNAATPLKESQIANQRIADIVNQS